MHNRATWLERYRQRHDWALQAFDRFVHELAPEISDQVQRSDQVTVVVYGATQVGKTTLILDLLGLASSTHDEVARVLRGGQAGGKSATAVPLRYGRSPDDTWHIGDIGQLDAVQATRELAEIRRQVEQGVHQDTTLTDIRIPRRLFPSDAENALEVDVKLIDLPGLDSHNGNERHLVEQLARRYVTVADLVLLVTQANSLGFLQPENLQMEELAQWASQPVRYRLVVTSAFSLSSVRKNFEQVPIDVQAVRQAMIREIATLEMHVPQSFVDNLYVLELGDSARELANEESNYYPRIAPVISEFRRRLIADIKSSSGPFSRLYAAFQLDRVVQGQIAMLRAAYDECRAGFDAQAQALESQLSKKYPALLGEDKALELRAFQEGLDAEQKAEEQLRNALTELQRADFTSHFKSAFAGSSSATGERSVSALQNLLEKQKQRLKGKARTWTSDVDRLLQEKAGDEARSRLGALMAQLPAITFDEEGFHAIEGKLDGYSTDGYFWTSNFEQDVAMLYFSVQASEENFANEACRVFMAFLKRQIEESVGNIYSLKRQQKAVAADRHRLDEQHEQLKRLRSELATKLARKRSALQVARLFERRINGKLLETLHAVKAGITNGPTATDKFLAVLNTRLLVNEAEKLFAGKRPR
ncbi:dynamin family protein [Pseudomonas sp. abacavir_1]